MTRHRPPHPSARIASTRFSTLFAEFVVHLAAWTAFASLTIASESFSLGDWVGYALGACAAVAAIAALMIIRSVPLILRIVLGIVVIGLYGVSGIAEVVYIVAPPPVDSAMWTFAEPFPYAATIVMPVIVAAVTVPGVSAIRVDSRDDACPSERSLHRGGLILLVTVGLLLAWPAVMITGELIPAMLDALPLGLPILTATSGCAVAGVLATLVLIRGFASLGPGDKLTVARVAGFVVLVCGQHMCIIAIAKHFDTLGVGIGDMLLLICAFIGYLVAATVLGFTGLRSRAGSRT